MRVVLTGIGLAVPGVDGACELDGPGDGVAEPVDPAARLGRKGLRYKDRATRLAYCAARDALDSAGLLGADGPTVPAAEIATVVSSNLGNVDTVCRTVDTIAEETVTGTRPMDLPNASSNVIASSIAIRFGLRGPNLMLCNGATSGLDAVSWARTLLAAGRARRVLVAGAEPVTDEVLGLLGPSERLDGAAALLIETEQGAQQRARTPLAEFGSSARAADLDECLRLLVEGESEPALWHVPGTAHPSAELLADVPRADLTARFGAASGALGVLQCAAAAGFLDGGGSGPVLLTNGGGAATSATGLVLHPAGGDRG